MTADLINLRPQECPVCCTKAGPRAGVREKVLGRGGGYLSGITA